MGFPAAQRGLGDVRIERHDRTHAHRGEWCGRSSAAPETCRRRSARQTRERRHWRNGGEVGGAGSCAAAIQCVQNSADEKFGEARHRRRGGANMGFLEWATSPWGQRVPIHIAWYLIWVCAIAGLAFLVVHAIWVKFFAKEEVFQVTPLPAGELAAIPEEVKRHSLAARLFHWIMAAAMLTLLLPAFLPKVGVQFPWVTYHWIAGIVLISSIIFHIIHATFFM